MMMEHQQVLERGFACRRRILKISVGSGDGLALQQYSIVLLPTFILKGDVDAYVDLIDLV